MSCNVYLDESGDLGWKFSDPYRRGGSSRYLTIAYIICPPEKKHLPQRIVKSVYERLKAPPSDEIKGSSLSLDMKKFIAEKTLVMLEANRDIFIGCITVRKERVSPHIKDDGNKLYNYMIRLSLLENIAHCDIVSLIRDNRSIKVKSGNSLIDYLQMELWFEMNVPTKIVDCPSDSKQVKNLKYIDWINNIVWSNYEDSNSEAFNILRPGIRLKQLFF